MTVTQFGRYSIKREIGRGGMATVFLAYDPRFEREVAIKVLPREYLHNPTFRARFEREAKTIAALDHHAIVPVFDFGEEDGQPYLVMRYMTGGSLEDCLRNEPLTCEEASRIISHLASALDEAHDRGIVHRDLKPGNILFDKQNIPYIADFGIVKLGEQFTSLTGGGIVGTPAYMSPEQARGEPGIDGRSDIYALGAILFQMLTKRLPFEAETPTGQIVKALTEPVPNVLDYKADLPCDCQIVIERAMAKQKQERFTTASEMAEAFEAVIRRDRQSTQIPEVDIKPLENSPRKAFLGVPPGAKTEQEEMVEPQIAHAPLPGLKTWQEHTPAGQAEPYETIQPGEKAFQVEVVPPSEKPPLEVEAQPVKPQPLFPSPVKIRWKASIWVWTTIGVIVIGLCLSILAGGLSSMLPSLKRTATQPPTKTSVASPVLIESLTPTETFTHLVSETPSITPWFTNTKILAIKPTTSVPSQTKTMTLTTTPTLTLTFIPSSPSPTRVPTKKPKLPTKTPVPP